MSRVSFVVNGRSKKNFRENFVGELGDNVEARDIVDLATAVRIDLHQIGMRETCCCLPCGGARLGVFNFRGDEFDDGRLRMVSQIRIVREVGEKHTARLRAAEPFKERKSPVGKAPNPLAADGRFTHGFDHTFWHLGTS